MVSDNLGPANIKDGSTASHAMEGYDNQNKNTDATDELYTVSNYDDI
ncbi:hypothetical protein A3Q56_07937, partial [Intoshia linei]